MQPVNDITSPNGAALSQQICIPYRDEYLVFSLFEIEYIESDNNYCKVFCAGEGRFYLVQVSLRKISQLICHTHFCRVHDQYIVSLPQIQKLNVHRTRLVIKSGSSIPIGRSYKQQLLSRMIFLK